MFVVKTVLTIFVILSTTTNALNIKNSSNHPVLKIIKFYKISTLIVWRNNGFDEDVQNVINDIVYLDSSSSSTSKLIISNFSNKTEFNRRIDRENTLSIVLFSNSTDTILDAVDTSLQNANADKIVFLLMNSTISHSGIREIFQWAWKRSTINSVLIHKDAQGLWNTFRYEPFPNFEIQNISEDSATNYFPNKEVNNFRGYEVKVNYAQLIPKIYKYNISKGKEILSGLYGRTFMEFSRQVNLTVNIQSLHQQNESIFQSILKFLKRNETDICMIPLLSYSQVADHSTYPLQFTRACVLVPYRKMIPAFMYILQPFKINLWITLCGSIFLLAGLLFTTYNCSFLQKIEFGKLLYMVFSATLYLPQPQHIINLKSWRIRLIYLQLFALGFVLTNIYLSLMTSFSAKVTFGKQIDSIDEMVESGIKIMIYQTKSVDVIKNNLEYSVQYKKLFYIVDETVEQLYAKNLNTSYGYFYVQDTSETLLEQQKYLKYPLMRISNFCGSDVYSHFGVQKNSYFREPIKNFVMLIQQSGLDKYWISKRFNELVSIGYLKRMINQDNGLPKPIKVEQFSVLWKALIIGNVSGFICFLIEMNFKKMVKYLILIRMKNK